MLFTSPTRSMNDKILTQQMIQSRRQSSGALSTFCVTVTRGKFKYKICLQQAPRYRHGSNKFVSQTKLPGEKTKNS
jgi:hypothetical protein